MIDDLLSDHRAQLQRLLDLYLAGDFTRELLTDRKSRLEKSLYALEQERVGLIAQLEARRLTVDQLQTIRSFPAEVTKGLDMVESRSRSSSNQSS